MHVPLWALRLAPYVGGLLLAGGAYLWVCNRCVSAERGKWQAEVARAEKAAAAKTAAMQAQVDAAGVALSEMQSTNDALRRTLASDRRTYYVQNPAAAAAVCLSDGRYVHHQRADRDAASAIAAGAGAAGVQDSAAALPVR